MSFEITAIVEIPHGSMYKYEVDKNSGNLVIDRPLSEPLPYNYGYVPNTLHGDGDPLDICIVGRNPIFPLTKVKVVLLGAFLCEDNGQSDDKLVGAVVNEIHSYHGLEALLPIYKNQIERYLTTYKSGFIVKEWVDSEKAYEILMKDLDTYQNT